MKIYCIRDTEPYSYLTVWYDYQNFAAADGHELISFDSIHQFLNTVRDASPCLFLAEAATLQRVNLADIKSKIPHSYITILGSDSIHYGLDPQLNPEVPGLVEHTDLWLDLHDDIVVSYAEAGVKTKKWYWTTSEWFVRELSSIAAVAEPITKDRDYIGLFRNNTDYRKDLWRKIEGAGLTSIKSGEGVTYDAGSLFNSYARSRFCLGTTSPSWTNCRTVKGFRDWIAPLCGTVLVYDNHKSILLNHAWEIPNIYKYSDPIPQLEHWVRLYNQYGYTFGTLEKQKAWVRANTICKQLQKIFWGF